MDISRVLKIQKVFVTKGFSLMPVLSLYQTIPLGELSITPPPVLVGMNEVGLNA